jgi:hypothetical protein
MRYPRAELRVAGSRTNVAADKEARSEKITNYMQNCKLDNSQNAPPFMEVEVFFILFTRASHWFPPRAR